MHIFGGQLNFALWLLSHASSFFWGVLWVRAMFRARSPPPGQQAKYAYFCYQIKCKGELVKWCFINKVREEHDQIINRFGTGATRLANHPNEHNEYK